MRIRRSALRFGVLLAVVISLAPAAASAAGPDLRLVNAVGSQDQTAVRDLLKQGADVNAARTDGVTALLWATHFNNLETVQLLLKAGAKVNAADDHGVTPLAQACENANPPMVEQLLAAGADPNAAQASGLTPLMIATHTGNAAVVKALLAKGANVNAITAETKDTALMWAIADGHRDLVRVLLDARADVHVASRRGFTPLMFAARSGDIEAAKLLIAAGAKVNDLAPDGTHVLPFAIVSGRDDFALFLLEQGADPNGSMGGVSALHAASGGVDLWLADWNRRHGGAAGVFAGGSFGRAPRKGPQVVKALLAKGADVNARTMSSAMLMSYIGYPKKGAFEPFACGTGDLRGATPLWVAAYSANGSVGGFGGDAGNQFDGRQMGGEQLSSEIIRALLAGGADQRLTTDDRTTPLMVAAGLGRSTFDPALITVRKGEQIRFVLQNDGTDDHEFVLASAAENRKHAELMKKFPDMEHDDPNAKRLAVGEHGEILWKFTKTGTFEFACLIPGHREAGMLGKVVVK